MRGLPNQFELIVILSKQFTQSFGELLAPPIIGKDIVAVRRGEIRRDEKGLVIEQGGVDVGAWLLRVHLKGGTHQERKRQADRFQREYENGARTPSSACFFDCGSEHADEGLRAPFLPFLA